MMLTMLKRMSKMPINPKIQTHPTVSGTNAKSANSERPKEISKKRKTMNPQRKRTLLKSLDKVSTSLFSMERPSKKERDSSLPANEAATTSEASCSCSMIE